LRRQIMEGLSAIKRVDAGGDFMNNTNGLKDIYHDDKIQFLKQYSFNICPENSNATGYVTEKVFDAILAGCIPIYWGSDQNPEPNILNKNALLFWDEQGSNEGLLQAVQDLVEHPKAMRAFMEQPRLLPHASEYICDMLLHLEKRLIQLLKEHAP
jgi:alpha(1,3/1,4) fucosyltransferase